jgi:hypothetical protein
LWNRAVAAQDGALHRARHRPQVQRGPEPLEEEELPEERRRYPDNHRRRAEEEVAAEVPQPQEFPALLPVVRAADSDVRPALCT